MGGKSIFYSDAIGWWRADLPDTRHAFRPSVAKRILSRIDVELVGATLAFAVGLAAIAFLGPVAFR